MLFKNKLTYKILIFQKKLNLKFWQKMFLLNNPHINNKWFNIQNSLQYLTQQLIETLNLQKISQVFLLSGKKSKSFQHSIQLQNISSIFTYLLYHLCGLVISFFIRYQPLTPYDDFFFNDFFLTEDFNSVTKSEGC